MKILSWNLNHRIQLKVIPDAVLSIINEISPDLIVLNEYVDGEERLSFKNGLNEIGFLHISVSQKLNRQNQVLIASKAKHERGDLNPPPYDEASVSNFLHVVVPAYDIEIVGLRVPAYKNNFDLTTYWCNLLDIIRSTICRNIVFIGDFNCNPAVLRTPGAKCLNILCEENWRLPIPKGNWSYVSYNGQKRSRLDYAIGSPEVGNMSGIYISKLGSYVIAGTKVENPISDHAILISEISPNK
ncbi:MAG: endonuclease/exonuclease/phosphatase family protein [Smithella sp.]|nr:endonuclease/exonuclease/phosphatase family protein [Smithella sp.]